jgi:hypothetical protein
MIFDKLGKPKSLMVDDTILSLIDGKCLKPLRLSNHYLSIAGQTFLFEDNNYFHIFHLILKSEVYHLERGNSLRKMINDD